MIPDLTDEIVNAASAGSSLRRMVLSRQEPCITYLLAVERSETAWTSMQPCSRHVRHRL